MRESDSEDEEVRAGKGEEDREDVVYAGIGVEDAGEGSEGGHGEAGREGRVRSWPHLGRNSRLRVGLGWREELNALECLGVYPGAA